MCLWNGLIAAAPGHPFLARVIETVVNNVRNRFTSVDVDNLFCPDPELSILHAFDTLFTAGPCILGATINKVLGRNGQTQFEAGSADVVRALPGGPWGMAEPMGCVLRDPAPPRPWRADSFLTLHSVSKTLFDTT